MTSSEEKSTADPRSLLGDKILLIAIALSATGAVGLGLQFVQATLAFTLSAALVLLAVAGYLAARGTLASRLLLTTSLVGLIILHIQLSAGTTEAHFGVFVTLALAMVYLDWRPIVLAAVLFAAHHLLFDRMMAAGLGVYCLNEPSLVRVVVHAFYVVAQTGLEVMLVQSLARSVREGVELQALVQRVNQPDGIVLGVRDFKATTPLGQALQATLERMEQVVSTIRHSIDSIRATSQEIASGNQDLSTRTESAASGIEETAASMEELTGTVRHSADAARQASEMALNSAETAERGGQAVKQVVSTMDEINHSSQKINDIIGVIDGIAFQTNILALNAAVEAARAGEQGRGFAVVAAEVRSLAQRSALAAKEITVLIGASVQKVDSGTRLVRAAGDTITEVVDRSHKVSAIISEISRATAEQSSGIGQINQAISQFDDATQHNAALSEQSLTAARELDSQAGQLAEAVAVFR
ncbi:MAG: hypothetical protein RLZZ22_1725 [Pseudomonadota bacterium]|jgi:methyl-accepting chemotaxis protein